MKIIPQTAPPEWHLCCGEMRRCVHCATPHAWRRWLAGVVLVILLTMQLDSALAATDAPLSFGVLNQHTVTFTAQIWNPVLAYLSERSGEKLILSMGKTASQTLERTAAGEYDIAYTNQLFAPRHEALGYRPVARLNRPAIRAMIVVREDSRVRSPTDLQGRPVAFSAAGDFIAHRVALRRLQEAGVSVVERFAGNQEGGLRQLIAGTVDAVAVNDKIMRAFTKRETLSYRVIWTSQPYQDLAVMLHPRLSMDQVNRIRNAMLGMHHDPRGREILDAANRLLGNPVPLAFVAADSSDYLVYRDFWQADENWSTGP